MAAAALVPPAALCQSRADTGCGWATGGCMRGDGRDTLITELISRSFVEEPSPTSGERRFSNSFLQVRVSSAHGTVELSAHAGCCSAAATGWKTRFGPNTPDAVVVAALSAASDEAGDADLQPLLRRPYPLASGR